MSILSTARRLGISKGVLGGNRKWLIIGAIAWTLRALRWAWTPSPKTVYRKKLEVGETIVVRHDPPRPTRRQRRKTKRQQRKLEKRSAKRLARQRKGDMSDV
ncbi:MAG: hypothetical protein RLZZ31_92 [Actinomycetota bacterium]